MRTRTQIDKLIDKKQNQIDQLKQDIIDLVHEDYLLNDKDQWFTEEMETKGKGKKKRTELVGRVNWFEDFLDEDTGEVITINRSKPVRINGEWL